MTTHLVELNVDNFSRLVAHGADVVVARFSVSWCQPCEQMAAVFLELANELPDFAVYGVVDVAVSPTIAHTYGVRSVPSVAVFLHGTLAKVIPGQISLEELKRLVVDAVAAQSSCSQVQERVTDPGPR